MGYKAVLLLVVLLASLTASPAFAHPILESDIGALAMERGAVAQLQQDGIPYYTYLPSTAPTEGQVVPLLAIHGFGEDPNAFLQRMIPVADKHGWLLVAPDLPSGDWRDPAVIKADARRNLPWLHRLVERVRNSSPVLVADRTLVYGFSLGAQTGHRFALAYPENVLAAAVMSAGTYTIPIRGLMRESTLTFPMATTDLDSYSGQPFDFDKLKKTRIWVGVGDQDSVSADVPREFDGIEGLSRRERAESFAHILKVQGISVEFQAFPGQAHYETPQSLDAAASFLDQASRSSQ